MTSSPSGSCAPRRCAGSWATWTRSCAARWRSSSGSDDAALVQQRKQSVHGDGGVARMQDEVRGERRLVGVVDAGHALDLAGAGLRVQALGVAALALLERRVDEHLDEVQPGGLVGGARRLAIALVGRDQG